MRSKLIAIAILLSMAIPAVVRGESQMASAGLKEMMLTIFLRHDQSKTLDQIDRHLHETGFRKNFPPPGVEVVS